MERPIPDALVGQAPIPRWQRLLARLVGRGVDAARRRALARPRWKAQGVPIVVALMPAGERKALAQRVANALGVIARYDARRMARIRRDLRAVLVWPFVMPGTAGQYLDDDAICILNPEMVEKWRAIQTAMIIVHEATHARLRHCAYVPSSAGRIEQRCKKEEIAFASRLPGSERLQQLLWKEVEAVGSREYTAAARTSRAIDHMEREGASRALLVLLRRIARLRRPHASPSDQRE